MNKIQEICINIVAIAATMFLEIKLAELEKENTKNKNIINDLLIANKKLIQKNEELKEKIKKYSKINEQDTRDFAKLEQAFNKLIPILENYATSTIGRKQVDGTYKFVCAANKFGDELCLNYDPRPAIEGLNIIKKVKEK